MFRADAGKVVEQGIFEPLLLDNPLICHRLAVFAPARFSAAASQKLGWAAAGTGAVRREQRLMDVEDA